MIARVNNAGIRPYLKDWSSSLLVLVIVLIAGRAQAFQLIENTIEDSDASRFVTVEMAHQISAVNLRATAFYIWSTDSLNRSQVGTSLRIDLGNGVSITPSIQRLENTGIDIAEPDEADTYWLGAFKIEYQF